VRQCVYRVKHELLGFWSWNKTAGADKIGLGTKLPFTEDVLKRISFLAALDCGDKTGFIKISVAAEGQHLTCNAAKVRDKQAGFTPVFFYSCGS
jgi:hypothetical protein